ncbi:glycosyltransferase family 2 protein [Shewanella xiamenensis]|uniref:glycosyltransferase family 2 protein n=1 Tax=Shewanella xiamenensis TaxID=332186 RepID=UPI0035BB5BD8
MLLSIVIPTKNRISYLKYIVDYFKEIIDSDIELIVQDNSDSNIAEELREYIDILQDARIIYNYSVGTLSQQENCDLAIRNASGYYILMLGDDDIFSKHIIQYCRQWKQRKIDAVLTYRPVYIWPDVTPRLYKEKLSSSFKLSNFTRAETMFDLENLKKHFLSSGGTEIGNMPRVYHGIASKECLDKIQSITGSYCPGPSPDIANAISLLYTIKNFLYVDAPLIVSGQCIKSAAGKGCQGQHYDEIVNVKQLPINQSSKWFKHIPFYWSGKTIYAQSSNEALINMRLNTIVNELNREYLLASCLVFDIKYYRRILKCVYSNGLLKLPKVLTCFLWIWSKRFKVHYNLFFNGKKTEEEFFQAEDIRVVIDLIDERIGS